MRRGGDAQGRSDEAFAGLLFRRDNLQPQLPKDFKVVRAGNGIRLTIIGRNAYVDRSGSTLYAFGWSGNVDTSTKDGRDAGAVRAEQCGQVAAPRSLDTPATYFLSDQKYQSGTFYCWGVDNDGRRSPDYLWSQLMTGDILDDAIPGDPTHVQASESGEELTPGVISSVLTVSLRTPIGSPSYAGNQLFLKDYSRLGTTEEADFRRFNGAPGGSMVYKVPFSEVRRKGTGTITLIAGNTAIAVTGGFLLSEAQAGDQIECCGARTTIASITDNGTATFVGGGWTGPGVTAFADWKIVPLVTILFVSISKGGTHRSDVENAPFVRELFDGVTSAPVAPTILAATAMGNIIRVDVQQPIGTALDKINVYVATGASQPFSSAVQFDSLKLNTNLPNAAAGILTFSYDKFTIFQREQGQVFTFYAEVLNLRGDKSPPSTGVNATARLDAGQDNGPDVPARDGFKNMLFDGFIGGDGVTVAGVNNVVDDSDSTQDNFNFNPAIAPNTLSAIGPPPSGTSRLRAWSRWKWSQTNQTTIYPTHINSNEVKLPAPGGSTKDVRINQYVLAWAAGSQIDRKIAKGGYYTLQVKLYCDSTPNGTFAMGIAQFYQANASAWALLRTRHSDDTVDESSGPYLLAGMNILTSLQRVFATFRLNPAYQSGNTDKIAITFIHQDSTSGNIFIKEAGLNEGIELGPWTGDMGNIDMSIPVGQPPSQQPDPPGHGGPQQA